MSDAPIVIVGGGLAGALAAQTLREEGFPGPVVLITREDRLPYERPPLSKAFLTEGVKFENARANDEAFYKQNDIELRTGVEATELDTGAHRLTLSTGEQLGYSKLLIASGADPVRPPIPGADGDAVHLLRTVEDSERLREAITAGGRIVIVGAGWIGSEVAASARTLGADVTVVEQAALPLERILGERLGSFFADLHRSHGVDLRLSNGVAAIEDGGRRVVLADGSTVDAAAVLLAVGARPAVALARSGGLEIDNGVLADEMLRTSAHDVWVAGDIANAMHPRYGRLRVEHWDNAREQGAAAARSMLGKGEPYARIPYFFSDQYDLGLEYFGRHDPADELTIEGDIDGALFRAVWRDSGGAVSAAMHVNDWDAGDELRALVEQR